MRLNYKFLIIFLCFITFQQGISSHPHAQPGKPLSKKEWVDSVYKTLNMEDRIGQLFMVAAYSGGKNFNDDQITKLLAAHQVGGLIFMQGGPVRQAMLTNKYQAMAQVPLLIAMDAEWGLGMRLDSIRNMPRQMMLGATRDSALVYKMGAAVAYQCKRLGVHLDFAPVIDVNNNSNNPVINSRSFGEDKTYVAKLGIAYMNGLQKNGVMACAKHFPGHGDTNVDSHKDLPLIPKSLAQLDSLELYPFKQLVDAGIKSVMVAHLEVPCIDSCPHVPTSLSLNAVTTLLKYKLGFQGLVITDALGMQGVTKYFPAGDADLKAFQAGNDILLFSGDVPAAIAKIKNAIDSGKASAIALEYSVKKILSAKYDAGLQAFTPIDTTRITDDLNKYTDFIRTKVADEAITLVKDGNNILPKLKKEAKVAYVGIDADGATPLFQQLAAAMPGMEGIWAPKNSSREKLGQVADKVSDKDAVIVAVHNINFSPGSNYGLHDDVLNLVKTLSEKKNTFLVLLGNAYTLQYVPNAASVMVSYEDDSLTELSVANILLNKAHATGNLPVTAITSTVIATTEMHTIGAGSPFVCPTGDLQKAKPIAAGVIDSSALKRLDKFISSCIDNGAFPGCRLLAARDGKVFYDKSFGYYTNITAKGKTKRPVDSNTLYDMASCTKMLATTLAVMRLYEQGKLDIEKTIKDYLPEAKGTNKADIKLKDLLCHQAGLKSWIPFYKETVDGKGRLNKKVYRKKAAKDYSILVAKGIYMRNDYVDTMWSRIYSSPLENVGKSVYSDLDYIFLGAIAERITGEKLDKYVDREFYKPLGLKHTTFKPLDKFDIDQVAPTEQDAAFRGQLVQGYVHDPGAAMFGGVAGHAGLFSTAGDAAVIMQMLMNGGFYGGKRYFKASTLATFTAYQSRLNHRGYGFDKPTANAETGGPAGDRTSGLAFGHQGFTGTCAWADPATGIVFIFLSNRVNPTAENNVINHLNVRTVAQDIIYESLGIPVNTSRDYIYETQVGR